MIVAVNSVPMKEKAEVLYYDKMKNERESISVWRGHNLYNKVYGMLDQATSWRSKGGGHQWKAQRWSKNLLHYAMFGVLGTNIFLNMKLANPNEKTNISAVQGVYRSLQ